MKQHLVLALWEFWWQGLVLALLYMLAKVVVPARRADWRYAIAMGAMLLMPVCVLVNWMGIETPIPAEPFSGQASKPNPVLGLAFWLWVLGVLALSVRLLHGWWRLRSIIAAARPALDWTHKTAGLAEVRWSAAVGVPCVAGWLRPVVLFPLNAAGLPLDLLDAVLAHELAHVRRHDYAFQWIQNWIEVLLYYHPAVWWLSREVRRERECATDEMAAASLGDRGEYARALLTLEELQVPNAALAANGGDLSMRIHRLMRSDVARPAGLAPLLLLALSLGMVFFEPLFAQALSPVYDKWLKEDVRHIIEAKEAHTFVYLKTNEEAEKFIEQFWLRRDPTPGTPENEAKVEHYRRISYAKARFGEGGKAGSDTERGACYIKNGPPDEIEEHASKGLTVWRYKDPKTKAVKQDVAFLYPSK